MSVNDPSHIKLFPQNPADVARIEENTALSYKEWNLCESAFKICGFFLSFLKKIIYLCDCVQKKLNWFGFYETLFIKNFQLKSNKINVKMHSLHF